MPTTGFGPSRTFGTSAQFDCFWGQSGRTSIRFAEVRVGPGKTTSTVRSLGQDLQQGCKALFNVLAGSVDRDMITAPRFVVPRHNLVPGNRDIDGACFYPATMLARVRAHDLYFHRRYCGTLGDPAPSVACDLQRIDRVPNNRVAQA